MASTTKTATPQFKVQTYTGTNMAFFVAKCATNKWRQMQEKRSNATHSTDEKQRAVSYGHIFGSLTSVYGSIMGPHLYYECLYPMPESIPVDNAETYTVHFPFTIARKPFGTDVSFTVDESCLNWSYSMINKTFALVREAPAIDDDNSIKHALAVNIGRHLPSGAGSAQRTADSSGDAHHYVTIADVVHINELKRHLASVKERYRQIPEFDDAVVDMITFIMSDYSASKHVYWVPLMRRYFVDAYSCAFAFLYSKYPASAISGTWHDGKLADFHFNAPPHQWAGLGCWLKDARGRLSRIRVKVVAVPVSHTHEVACTAEKCDGERRLCPRGHVV